MAGRLAYRPRYRNMHQIIQTSFNVHQKFFSPRWIYRHNRSEPLPKRPLGHSLSLLPIRHRLARQLVVYQF